MRLDLLDYKIIKIFYNKEDWNLQMYTLEDLRILGVEDNTLRYHLKKLVKINYITGHNTYPRYWEPILDKKFRDKMEKIHTQSLKELLR